MKIERINDNTVKFFITYVDIEKRGFARDEIWYNRERGEQLFWQMMDEAHEREDISFDGPLWIQVQAFEKGLEVTVTIAKNVIDAEDDSELGSLLRSAIDEARDQQSVLDQLSELDEETEQEAWAPLAMETDDFEAIISLSKRAGETLSNVDLKLFHYDQKYYLWIDFPEEMEPEEEENVLSLLAEYLTFSTQTLAMLEEYGKLILDGDVFSKVRHYF
ncbi:adaptor protein MecA [Exiguobacterium aurantiacum]|uniref:Adapter protein MecA n=1 Tax=Exiguobacterium aurantiacum TaxID=33987 RepID=A0ABY5FKI4_9BACL|nr:adaptor protein MecA [Exiguobacterium aurantiacum]UTT41963.1 adaptor protein MecA [Exiguobacterium aurantiacum]